MRTFIDQLHRQISIPDAPQRIVSLVPSQTELLIELEITSRLAGVTRFCVHPEDVTAGIPKVGGTKKIHMARLRALEPDLIIGNKEENNQAQIEELARDFPVWMSDVITLQDALDMIEAVGEIVESDAHEHLVTEIAEAFSQLGAPVIRPRVAYLIWDDPVMVAATGTFIDSMMTAAGLNNVFGHLERYPVVTDHDILQQAPDVLILSSEPYAFTEEHLQAFHRRFPGIRPVTADATYFSWYGSRLRRAPAYFAHLVTYLQMR